MSNRPQIVVGPVTITRAAKSALDQIQEAPTRAALVAAEERAASEASVRRGGAPRPVIGVSTMETVAAERARSARQAELAHARGRKAQQEANPGLISATTWTVDPRLTAESDPDGADYVVPAAPASMRRPEDAPPISGPAADEYVRTTVNRLVNPGTGLSTSRPAEPERHPGLAPYQVNLDELSGPEKQLIRGVQRRVCEVNFCNEVISSKTRRRCADHALSDRGVGLKDKE